MTGGEERWEMFECRQGTCAVESLREVPQHASLQLDVNNIRKYIAREMRNLSAVSEMNFIQLNDIKRAFKRGQNQTNRTYFVLSLFVALLCDQQSPDRIVTKDIRMSKRNKNVRKNGFSETSTSWVPGNSSSHLHVSSRRVYMLSN